MSGEVGLFIFTCESPLKMGGPVFRPIPAALCRWPFIYCISASGLGFFNQEKFDKMIKALSGLADKIIKRRKPKKVGKGGMGKADPTGHLP